MPATSTLTTAATKGIADRDAGRDRSMQAEDGTREEASALADLQFHWDERYVVAFDGSVWSARWKAGGEEFTAGTAEDLRHLIREDYARRRRADYSGLRERMST